MDAQEQAALAQISQHVDQLHQATQNMVGTLESVLRQFERMRRRLFLHDAAASMRAAGTSPRFPVEFRAQYGEDMFLWELFDGKCDGFFIEVGAFDGYNFAVTYAFEAVGWNGLLIEPLPERCEQCRARRPFSRVVNAALSKRGSSGTAAFESSIDEHGGMLSHLQRAHDPMITPEYTVAQSPSSGTIQVPLTTMDSVLGDHRGPIDIAVLDVEGAEPSLLDGFDLARWRPRALLIEDNTRGSYPALDAALAGKPYVFCGWQHINRVYIREGETDLLQRVRNLL